MAQKCAFEAAVDDLSAATVQLGNGDTFDIAAALKKDGRITLDRENERDRLVADALNHHPAVKPATTNPKRKD